MFPRGRWQRGRTQLIKRAPRSAEFSKTFCSDARHVLLATQFTARDVRLKTKADEASGLMANVATLTRLKIASAQIKVGGVASADILQWRHGIGPVWRCQMREDGLDFADRNAGVTRNIVKAQMCRRDETTCGNIGMGGSWADTAAGFGSHQQVVKLGGFQSTLLYLGVWIGYIWSSHVFDDGSARFSNEPEIWVRGKLGKAGLRIDSCLTARCDLTFIQLPGQMRLERSADRNGIGNPNVVCDISC